jgi:hypothetical protein
VSVIWAETSSREGLPAKETDYPRLLSLKRVLRTVLYYTKLYFVLQAILINNDFLTIKIGQVLSP